MEQRILVNERELACAVASDIAEFINENPGSLLCLAAGDTPLAAYGELVTLQEQGKVDLNSVFYVGLDEWVGLGKETKGSCIQVMEEHFYFPAKIKKDRVMVWDGLYKKCEIEIKRIEKWIEQHGGIAYAVLGIGMNGHVGFNEPGTGVKEGGFLVSLDETTCNVSAKYFDTPVSVKYGVSIGIGEFIKAKKIVLMASGKRKVNIVHTLLTEEKKHQVPVSLLKEHRNILLYLDKAATGIIGAS